MVSNNLFAYCDNNPVNKVDIDGHIAISNIIGAIVGGIIGAVGGYFLTRWLADKLGLKGWKRTVFVWGLTAIITAAAAVIGYFIGPYLAKKGKTIVKSLRKLVKKACFVAGTSIYTRDGTIPIEQISVGDFVYAENPDTGEKTFKKVTKTFVNQTSELINIYMNDTIVTTTPSHPFYVKGKGWIKAKDLSVEDILVSSNSEDVTINKIVYQKLDVPVKVYNFEVEDFHTYFASDLQVLVHNDCVTDFVKKPQKYKKVKKLLNQFGFKEVRQKGSHVIFKDEITGITFPVPNHGSKGIPIGTLRSIFKAAGLL